MPEPHGAGALSVHLTESELDDLLSGLTLESAPKKVPRRVH